MKKNLHDYFMEKLSYIRDFYKDKIYLSLNYMYVFYILHRNLQNTEPCKTLYFNETILDLTRDSLV